MKQHNYVISDIF